MLYIFYFLFYQSTENKNIVLQKSLPGRWQSLYSSLLLVAKLLSGLRSCEVASSRFNKSTIDIGRAPFHGAIKSGRQPTSGQLIISSKRSDLG